MADNKMPVEEKVFQLKLDVESNGIITKTLQTADTYVDKNIKVTVTTPDAEFEVKEAASVTATASTTDTTYTSETETPYAIEIAADATAGAVKVGVKTPGFAADTDEVTVAKADAEQDTKTIYVKEGHLAGSGEASAESDSVKLTKGGAGAFQIAVSATGSASVDVAGWLPVGASADASGDATYAVQAATLANSAADETKYALKEDGPVLIEDSYLFINEGYIADTKIPLAVLVPDGTTVGTDTSSDLIYNSVVVYNDDGKRVTGTMGDAALTAITASDAAATISTVSVAAEGAGFKVTGSAEISGTASVDTKTSGLAVPGTTKASGVISGTADVNATLAKVGLAINADETDIEVTPVIAKEDSTTAKSGAITKTQPSGRYIAVSTAAIEASQEVSPIVATEGYGTTGEFSATGATITAGAAASGTYYVPVEAGSHTVEASEAAITNATATLSAEPTATAGFDGNLTAGILSTAPAGEYITITADAASKTQGSVSGTVSCTVTEGYVEDAEENKSISGNVDVEVTTAAKYIRVYDGSIL